MLFVDEIHLITKVRKKMKKKAMVYIDKVILIKRAIIESVDGILKKILVKLSILNIVFLIIL